ncbi:MAG: T9SS type A sorting domain-containing protein [Bacteroidota bacterium]
MKKLVLSITAVVMISNANAQCDELFFSEYVEGTYNNKALEIYNPTADTIDLSDYRIVRWSNGSTSSDQDIRYVQPLTGYAPPYGIYAAILDKRDPLAIGQDTILFPGLLDFGNAGNAGFYSPDYNSGTLGSRTLPFNGDDAISLEKDLGGGSWDIVDLFGLIGEQPLNGMGTTSPTGGWTNEPYYWNGVGSYWSRDNTLIRKYNIDKGVTANPGTAYDSPGNFNPSLEWDSLPVNTFDNLGFHNCSCNPTAILELSKKIHIKIYPNPISNTLLTIASSQKITSIFAYDILGQVICNQQPIVNQGICYIDLSGNNQGIYILKIYFDDNSVFTKKVILE